jgi:hypothetical protein
MHEVKAAIWVLRDQKTISINFHQVKLKVKINYICSKNVIMKNVIIRKKYCRMWVKYIVSDANVYTYFSKTNSKYNDLDYLE